MNRPKHLYYITHRDNLKSILKKGILSHNKAYTWWDRNIMKRKIIYDSSIIKRRKDRKDQELKGKSLLDYANVYFQARNPMLYRVIKEAGSENIVVLEINSNIIDISGIFITDGNAASSVTQLFEDVNKGLSALNQEQFEREYWSAEDGSNRKIMAEVLVHDHIPKEKIIGIYTANSKVADQIRKDIIGPLNLMPNPKMFFLPEYRKVIFPYTSVKKSSIRLCKSLEASDNFDTPIDQKIPEQNLNDQAQVTLKKGDMFFSEMETFTISVNTVGVMGKGLASRSKNQFPDVYTEYQSLCRQKKLKMGTPVLYKREANFVRMLMEDVPSIVPENGHRWFLLFPTKNHWRESSPIAGIEKGLQWLVENYKAQGITSLALPALGCGLGGLSWQVVGPLMCKYLKQMNIQSEIYLPLEKDIPKEHLQPEFLFNNL